jgi:hypothetical protein
MQPLDKVLGFDELEIEFPVEPPTSEELSVWRKQMSAITKGEVTAAAAVKTFLEMVQSYRGSDQTLRTSKKRD